MFLRVCTEISEEIPAGISLLLRDVVTAAISVAKITICWLCAWQFFGASRALLETLTRFKFLEQQLENVVLRSKSLVTGLSFNQDKSAVTGEGLLPDGGSRCNGGRCSVSASPAGAILLNEEHGGRSRNKPTGSRLYQRRFGIGSATSSVCSIIAGMREGAIRTGFMTGA
jgi:hypothetical protein